MYLVSQKECKLYDGPLRNGQSFNFQNLVSFWLSTSRLRFRYVIRTFSFTISRDIKVLVRTSDKDFFKKGGKQDISFRVNCKNTVFLRL